MSVFLIVILAIIAYIIIFFTLPSIVGYVLMFGKRTTLEADRRHLERTYMAPHLGRILEGLDFFRNLGGERVEITSFDGLKLRGSYYNQGSEKTVILSHGYNATPLYNFSVVGKEFYEKGYNVLMIIHRAHTGSEGKHSTMGLKEQKDVLKWIDWCVDEKKPEKIWLWGVSMGGAILAYASDKMKGRPVCGMTIDCAFISPYEQLKKQCNQYHVPWFFIMPTFYLFMLWFQKTDIKEMTVSSLENTEVPALFIHGTLDRTVTIKHTEMNYAACASEKELIIVQGADHTESYLAMSSEQRAACWNFIERHMEGENGNICHSDRFVK